MKMKKGFTLIELLVVIAIIALLSSVVFASLNSARSRASDNAVKAGMKQIAAQAEIYRDSNTSFGASVANCTTGVFSDSLITQMINDINAKTGSGNNLVCNTSADGTKWAVSTTLKGGGTWCVNNSGWTKAGTAAAGVCS